MIIGAIEGANCCMKGDGKDVADLLVIRTPEGFVSAWHPTPQELLALNRGAAVHLHIVGGSHPPVYVGVAGVDSRIVGN